MIYLFAGDDTKNKLISYEKFVKSLSAQRDEFKDTGLFFVNRNDFDPIVIESFYSGSSLFSAKSVVIFQDILEHKETRDFILDKLSLMEESTNLFLFLESKLNKSILDIFKKVLDKNKNTSSALNIFELPKEKKEKYDNFLVANAFGRKDKLNMWICFREAMDRGVGMEEIVGVLFWKIKNMLITKNFGKFSEFELKNLATNISYLLPKARKEGRDAESAFEQFLLKAF